VIVDIQMPAMSGVELQTLLLSRGHRVQFIFITTFLDEATRARAMKAGVVCFLAKLFDGGAFFGCVDIALERQGGETIA
jgi:FixJ family two-component response regulator